MTRTLIFAHRGANEVAAEKLQAMNFAAHYSARAKPEGIMSLKEFLDAYHKRCRLLLEIKNRDWEQISRDEMKVRQSL